MPYTSITTTLSATTALLAPAAPWIALGSLFFTLIALLLLWSVRRRFMRLSLGRTGSIEESVTLLSRDVKNLQTFRIELEKYLKNAEIRMQRSTQGIGVVRFNPFSGDGSGGNQSFSVAFLDERHCGVVFSTLYARDRVGVYAKPVENGISSFELTAEERGAIDKAKQSILESKKTPAA